MNASRWISGLLLALAMLAGAGWWLQRQIAAGLRTEIALMRDENREFAALRAKHERLLAAQPSADELARLRADHAAVIRMRSELDAMKADLARRERALAQPVATTAPTGTP